MTDALCGPSNALQSFQKHTTVDRTLQQDRFRSRQSPSQGFRTPKPDAGLLEAEFEAFKAGEPVYSEAYQRHDAIHNQLPLPQQSNIPSSQAIDWASDFQNLHVHDAQTGPLPSLEFRSEAPLQRHSSSPWQQEFLQQNKSSSYNHQQLNLPTAYTPYATSAQYPTYGNPYQDPLLKQQPESQVNDSFDEEAFERAFNAARMEVRDQEASLQQEDIEKKSQPAETALEHEERIDYRIGSDIISDEASHRNRETSNEQDADELARTAGQLLENVKHDQSAKFQQSNFLSLMRQLRDKEVKVEGDSIVDIEQPLHPGGQGYPDGSLDLVE
ncbi:MAG: hypothetical protein Q9215_005606 [Flavoplaca cf. flavocitrina]